MEDKKTAMADYSLQEPDRKDLRPRTLIDLLRRRAELRPEKRAYTFLLDGETEEVSLSYGQLNLQAQAIGKILIGMGLRGERALLLYPPGLDFIVGFFGCLYAGLIAVPAYPPSPAQLKRTMLRLEAIVGDAEAKVALTIQSVLSRMGQAPGQTSRLSSLSWLATDRAKNEVIDHALEVDSGAESIAFLQYTSGSTGRPRGVVLTHANLIHNASMVRAFIEHGPQDSYVSWLPAFHDMGFMSGVLQPLYSGIPAVLISPAVFLQRPFRWLRAISHYRATTSGGPNFAYDLCVRKISPEDRASLDLSSWTVAFNGSEPIRKETLERFAQTFAPCGFRRGGLYPCYGLAEATLIVSGARKGQGPIVKSFVGSEIGKGRVVEERSETKSQYDLVSSGRISKDEKVVIVHPESMIKCSPGEIGEIWVSGPSVAHGYWKNPAETERTFQAYIKNTNEGPFLRTGDLGFIHRRQLFIAGRLKDLIIIRGVNHYPQDIELSVENSAPGLRPGCGAAFTVEIDGEEKLVVAQEVDDRKQTDSSAIVDSIRRSIAEIHELQVYGIVLVKPGTIPKTSSGKIQRHTCRTEFLEGKLQEVYRSVLKGSGGSSREESFIRQALLAIESPKRLPIAESYILEQTAQVLQLSPAGLLPEQPLSTLGVDSLTAVELKNRIDARLHISIPVSIFLTGASAREVAQFALARLEASSSTWPALGETAEEPPVEYPLSYTQKALWFFYRLAPENTAYNVAFAVRISSGIDAAALERVFRTLVDRCHCLRTTFTVRGGLPVQRVHPQVRVELRRAFVTTDQDAELQRAIEDEAYRPFDLEQGPVFRASLYTRSPEDHVLLLAAHHIVIDGWSFWVLVDELLELYAAEMGGGRQPLPPSDFRYADYVRMQAEMLEGKEGENLYEYWKGELAGDLPILDLPTSRPRPPVQTYSGASYGFKLNEDLVSALKKLAASADATLYMVLLAVFQILLHRHTGQDDILVGSPISARSRAEFEELVGCFFNAIVLRADFSADRTFAEFLNRVRAKVLGALDHQEYPSHLLMERLNPARDPSRPPLFQCTFILQKRQRHGRAPIAFGDAPLPAKENQLTLSFLPIERKHARMELELEMIEADGAIYAWLHYNSDLFDRAAIGRMAGHYRTFLKGVAEDHNRLISSLPLLAEDEVEELLADQTLDLVPGEFSGLEEFFLEQVKKNPEKIAAVCNDDSMTFEELDKRSDRLADLIRRLAPSI
jgi:acyl-CoA synthetase (AMP-forming)/AMP-acid ligase II/acyl carrier protein